jgi:hypothetical protein
MRYNKLSDAEKADILNVLYIDQKKSFAEIAQQLDTYPNKIRRDAIKYKITIRNKSEAQKIALDSGKTEHPTKGKQRSDSVKSKIGLGVYESWTNLSDDEKVERSNKSKEQWDHLSDDIKEAMLTKAHAAVREAGKVGSKLEKFILENLIKHGFKTEFHKEHILSNTKLQIDIFVPSINTAIEIDGPSHFEAVWGSETLAKNKKYDDKKNGLIIGKGLRLIRIKQTRDFSKTRAKIIFDKLIDMINSMDKYQDTKIFYIED